MNKSMTRIFTAISVLLLWYFGSGLVANGVQLANAADRLHQGLGQYVFWGLMTIFMVLLITPVILYFMLPKALIPPEDKSAPRYDQFLTELRQRMIQNPRLEGIQLASNADIPAALAKLSRDADKIIRDTANNVFIGTAVMQNGRLDGLIVLAAQLRMVWQIAKIYYQRPSPRQMLYLYSNVSTTVFLANSIQEINFMEMSAPLVASVIPSLKGAIPGLQGIATLMVNSIANGSANAFLTLRVGIVSKQYCETLTSPDSQMIRKSATGEAFKLVGQITKDNGASLAKACWDTIRVSMPKPNKVSMRTLLPRNNSEPSKFSLSTFFQRKNSEKIAIRTEPT